ncbi:MAG: nicotinate-nucleotide diphosphorylase (carboxylating), partial [Actinobacteria bacterium]|nr:nicotinate-nucleotide diphosphorylase (carboxylating) [Actinomycetota bacterium]
MELSQKLREELTELGLSADYVLWIAEATIKEDLDGGTDVTSEATIPTHQNSIAEYRARKAGTIAGLHIAAAVLEVTGITDYTIKVTEGSHVEAGQL